MNIPALVGFLLIGYVTSLEWDAIVTTAGGILYFDHSWKQISSGGHQFGNISAFAYDEVRQLLYFSDLNDPHYRLFAMDTNLQDDRHKVIKLLPKLNETEEISGLAYDHLESKLYWTEKRTHSVYSATIDNLDRNINETIKLITRVESDHILAALAIDECRRHLYWTNSFQQKSNIVSAAMNGSIVNSYTEDVFQPMGISIDYFSDRIYWVEKKFGRAFTIESANLQIENKQTFLTGMDKVPTQVTAGNDYLYWIDQEDGEVHQTLKSNSKESKVVFKGNQPTTIIVKSALLLQYQSNNPSCMAVTSQIIKNFKNESAGVVHIKNETETAKTECFNKGIFNASSNSCVCPADYKGDFCELPVCNNYCLHGNCSTNETDKLPICKCELGFEGDRCDRNKCDGYCFNDGGCSLAESGKAQCTCKENFSGERCESAICSPDYCYNGKCIVENGLAKCTCSTGYRGERCEEYTCINYCLNDGTCVLNNKTRLVECDCGSEYTGKRCEIPKRFCSIDDTNPELQQYCKDFHDISSLKEPQVTYCKNTFNRTVVYASLSFSASLLILMMILWMVKRFYEEGRPRITKRFRVTNHTPLTSRPATQCEITIENCCNMNVCETPCFNPDLLQKISSKTEDKQFLLDDIESIAGSYNKIPNCSSSEKN